MRLAARPPDEFAAVLVGMRLPGPGCVGPREPPIALRARSAVPDVRNPGADDLTELERTGADSAFARPFDMAALRSAVAAAVANRIGGELFGNGA